MREDEEALSKLFLFAGMTPEERAAALADCHFLRVSYRRGESLCGPASPPEAVVLLLSGECDVLNGGVTLNTLGPGDCFGVLSLFGPAGEYPSEVTARKQTEALLLPKKDAEALLLAHPRAAVNLVSFLSGRVVFLNRRIALLS